MVVILSGTGVHYKIANMKIAFHFALHSFTKLDQYIFNEQVHVSEIVCIILHALNLLSTPCK